MSPLALTAFAESRKRHENSDRHRQPDILEDVSLTHQAEVIMQVSDESA